MLEVADIFRRYGGAYLKTFGDMMLPSHRRAFQDILSCRTPARGGHVFSCNRCGQRVYAYHSCRNRSCPKCHGRDTEAWLVAGKVAYRLGDRLVLVGDHTKVPKDGRKMPAVTTLHQNSETATKPSFFRGHHWGGIGMLVPACDKFFATPLGANI